jgi:hypothetical protein
LDSNLIGFTCGGWVWKGGMFYKKKPELKPKKMTNQKNKPKERKIKKQQIKKAN